VKLKLEKLNTGRICLEPPSVKGITIDGATSLELDDAFRLEITHETIKLSIHIADAAEHIPLGSGLDQEAFSPT
jgi:exoribonuclease R